MAKAVQLDFTKVKDGGNFNKRHQPAGDYPGKVLKVQDAKAKGNGDPMWLFTIQAGNGGTYPYYCKFTENQLWKIRNLCVAAGLNVPKKRISVDPNKLVGKEIGVSLEDEEYEGKMQSTVSATFPISELDPSAFNDTDDGDDDEPPTPKGKKKKSTGAEPVEEVQGKKGKKGKKKDKDAELDELDIDAI